MAAVSWKKPRQNVYFLGTIFIVLVTVYSGVGDIHRNLMWYIAGQKYGR
jgi:hypothetical protein